MRKFVFIGVSIAAMTSILSSIAIPLTYSHVQYLQSVMESEVDFCKKRTTNIWKEVSRTQAGVSISTERSKRQTPSCCGCGVSPPGLPGAPGADGKDGGDGEPGEPGNDGPDAPEPPSQEPIVSFLFENEPFRAITINLLFLFSNRKLQNEYQPDFIGA